MMKTFIFLFFLVFVVACSSGDIAEDWDKKNTREIYPTDTSYSNPILQARSDLSIFLDSLENKNENDYDFYIKSQFSDGDNVEHMWSFASGVKGENIVAVLDNVPSKLKNIKYRDQIKVKIEDIEDWIIYEGDSIIAGNYLEKSR